MRRDFRISFLIVKELLGGLSDEEQRELSMWKESHNPLYERLHKPENAGEHAARLSRFPADEAWAAMERRIRRAERRRHAAKAAAVILPVFLLAGLCMAIFDGTKTVPDTLYAEVVTMRGEEKSVVLPDGSRVRLNSMSRLTYPESFSDSERRVSLEGEALFDVISSDVPFLVSTPEMEIEVLGTLFDVSAYAGDATRTVLVEGSVRVSCPEGTDCILSPGQMASLSEAEGLKVERVETDFHTSWTRGRIYFRDERLEDIMTVLSRWYDFEVEYSDDSVKDLRFGCSVNRYDRIDPFIDLLVKTGRISVNRKDNHYLFTNN